MKAVNLWHSRTALAELTLSSRRAHTPGWWGGGMATSTRSRLALVLASAALAVSSTACKPSGTAAPHPSLSRPPVGTGKGGAGSITVSFTKPVSVSGHVDTTVTCTTGSRTYTASGSSALVAGYKVSFTVKVFPYHGPDGYPAAVVSLTLDGPTGKVGAASVPSPTTVTTSGGSFTVDTTSDNGQQLTASLEWACS